MKGWAVATGVLETRRVRAGGLVVRGGAMRGSGGTGRPAGAGLDRRAVLGAACLAALGAAPVPRAQAAGPRRIHPYDFPLTNPYAATVVGTPTDGSMGFVALPCPL